MKTKRPLTATLVFSVVALFLFVATSTVVSGQGQAETLNLTAAQSCDGSSDNVIKNHSFESGLNNWDFYSNGQASYTAASSGYHCAKSVKINITKQGTNVQLYQSGISLQANTDYVLRFVAKSSTGHDVKVALQKHSPNYNNYGLNKTINLTSNWKQFEVPFKTSGFSGSVNNGRLRFWLAPYDAAGDVYWFDQVEIVPADSSGGGDDPAPPPPDPEPEPPSGDCSTNSKNVLANPSFESGTGPWKFYTNGNGGFTSTSSTASNCDKSAQISITKQGTNVQLYQNDIRLQPNTRYRLTFSGKSNSGHNLSVSLQKHQSPYTNYGLRDVTANLTSSWKTFEYEFDTRGFNNTVNNGRIRFWFAPYDANGDKFYIDNVELIPLGAAEPDPDPPAPDPTPEPPPPGGGGGGGGKNEMVIYTWNGPVTEANRGFPWHQPPQENGNWVSPINYAQGTLYMRAQIRSQPVPQDDMRLQFCFWQEKNGNRFGLESCLTTKNVPGRSGTVECWSSPMDKLWKKGNKSIEWNRARYRVAVPIKNGAGIPVSDFSGWNWNGENPKHWYPLDMKVTVVVVAKGATFSGWNLSLIHI